MNKGFTLVEIVVSMVILAVMALGSLTYEYHARVHKQIADAELTATQVAQLLLEDWKSTGGSTAYDPTSLGLGFTADATNESLYYIEADGLGLFIDLVHQNVGYDSVTETTLRHISVAMAWRRDRQSGAPSASDPRYTLSTYVRTDASGG